MQGTAEGATPVTAQAHEPIGTGKSGERRLDRPPKGHAASIQAVISQVPRTDGAQHEFVLRLFYLFPKATMTLKTTPLNAAHRAMGAKMVDFGGWDMPVNYGSQIDEHHQVRNDCGMFDVCHMRVVDAKGDGVRSFLRYLLANNADKLAMPGRALYSAMLRPDGGVIDDLIIYFMTEQWFRIVVNAGTADKDIAWMKQQAATHAPKLTITSRDDLAMVAVQGPNARAKVWEVLPQTRSGN